MGLAPGDFINTSSIRKPKKPRRPTTSAPSRSLPTRSSLPTYNPNAVLDTSRITEVGNQLNDVNKTGSRANTYRPLTTQITADTHENVLFSAISNLLARAKPNPLIPGGAAAVGQQVEPVSHQTVRDTYSPYSNYAEMMDRENAYNEAPTGPVKVYQPLEKELRKPGDTVTSDGLRKRLARRISRRGGYGIYDPTMPIEGFDLSSGGSAGDFGPRINPATGHAGFHTGEDMSVAAGTPIHAAVGGIVTEANAGDPVYGNQVILNHGNSESTMYGHMNNFIVQPGEKVKKGQIIGYVGSTGLSTGPHLHWETWKNGIPLDPKQALALRDDVDPTVLNQVVQKFLKKHPQAAQNAVPSVSAPEEATSVSNVAQDYYEQRAFKNIPAPYVPVPQPQQEVSVSGGQPTGQLNALINAIRQQESGGNYGVQNGIGAMGAYQIMPSNIEGPAGWDMEALGQNITGEQFLNSPQLQDKIAKFKLKNYFDQYGPEGAAKAWYAGPGNADLDSDGPQYGGPSVNAYADSVLNIMKKYLSK